MASAWGSGPALGGSDYGISPYDFRRLSAARGADTQASVARSNASSLAAAQAQMAQSQAQDNDLKAKREANFNQAVDLTKGRGDAVMQDPYTMAALQRLQGVASGQDVPYTQQVQDQLLARQADAGSSAIDAQRQMIEQQQAALGGSMADPSAQAALRRLLAQNQQQNNANLGDMQSKATLTNFGARNDAAMNMAGVRGSQLGMANGQFNQAADLYANQQINGGHVDGVADVGANMGGGSSGWQTMGGGGSTIPFGSPSGGFNYGGNGAGKTNVNPYQQAPAYGGYSNSPTPTNRLQGPMQTGSAPKLTAGTTNWTTGQQAPQTGTPGKWNSNMAQNPVYQGMAQNYSNNLLRNVPGFARPQ